MVIPRSVILQDGLDAKDQHDGLKIAIITPPMEMLRMSLNVQYNPPETMV